MQTDVDIDVEMTKLRDSRKLGGANHLIATIQRRCKGASVARQRMQAYFVTTPAHLNMRKQEVQAFRSRWYVEVCVRSNFCLGRCEHINMQVREAVHSRFDGTTL